MSYEIVLGHRSLDRIRDVNLAVLDCLEDGLSQLAFNPVELGRRATLPHPTAMCYDITCTIPEGTYYFRAFFYYQQNERDLRVFDITFTGPFRAEPRHPPR